MLNLLELSTSSMELIRLDLEAAFQIRDLVLKSLDFSYFFGDTLSGCITEMEEQLSGADLRVR